MKNYSLTTTSLNVMAVITAVLTLFKIPYEEEAITHVAISLVLIATWIGAYYGRLRKKDIKWTGKRLET